MSGQRSDWRDRLHANPSRMEQEVAIKLQDNGIPYQTLVEIPITTADLYFQTTPRPLLVFIDGRVHLGKTQAAKDEELRTLLRKKGYKVLDEAQAVSNDWIFAHRISKPDFFLPQYNLVVEYWGLVDQPDVRKRDEYVRSMRWKMAQYRSNNIRFVSIYPSNMRNLDYFFRKKFRAVMGFDLPSPPKMALCSICHQQIGDWPLHVNWHARTTLRARA